MRHLRRFAVATAALALLTAAGSSASAAIITLSALLDAAQEVQNPAVVSPAFGYGLFELDDLTGQLSYQIIHTPSLLTSAEVAAHIHGPAPAGANAGVLFPLSTGTPKTGSVMLTAQQQTDLLNGLMYVNIHTSTYQQGEIRGQILPGRVVPEPTSVAMAAVAFLGLAVAGRRLRAARSKS